MDNVIKSVSPVHLEDQILYEFMKSVKNAKDVLGQKSDLVKLKPDYETVFRRDFGNIRSDVLGMIKSQNRKGLDPHKLAAIACLTVLCARPLYVPRNGEGHSVNELVAFLLAIEIIRNYQVARTISDKSKQKKLKTKLGSLNTPELIYDTQPVVINTILALRQLSRMLCPSKYASDVALLLSSLFFFIDAHSFPSVESLAGSL